MEVTANAGLVLFLAVFWGLLFVAVKVGHWWAGKRWGDGPSLIPVIPFVPVVAAVVGCLVNLFASPWGSWGVAGLHAGWLVVSLVGVMRHPPQRPDAEPGAAPDGRSKPRPQVSWVVRRRRVSEVAVVTGGEVVAEAVGRWLPTDVAFIRRFGFENCTASGFDLVLLVLIQPRPPLSVGWPDPAGPFWEAEIAFEGVRDFGFTVRGPWDVQCPGFDIEDISDRQWEGVRLLVYDYEGEPVGAPIRFAARSAAIRSCRPARYPPNSPMLSREYPGVFDGEA